MAYKAKMDYWLRGIVFEGLFVDHFWAIHKTVGWGCPNKNDDVMLVQYLVNVWAKEKALKMDGIFGNKTYKGILSFQKWINANWADAATADGRVTAKHVGGDTHTGSGGYFTIHALNLIYIEQRRIYYNDIRMDRELPPLLCHIFSAPAES